MCLKTISNKAHKGRQTWFPVSRIFNCLLNTPQGSNLTQPGRLMSTRTAEFVLQKILAPHLGRIAEEGWETSGKIILMTTELPANPKPGSSLRLSGCLCICTRELLLLTRKRTAQDDYLTKNMFGNLHLELDSYFPSLYVHYNCEDPPWHLNWLMSDVRLSFSVLGLFFL